MKRFISIYQHLILCAMVLFFASCQSTQTEKEIPGWENVTLHATGFGRIEKTWSITERVQAVQKAKIDAYAQLESDILALKINSTKKVDDHAKEDEVLKKKISAYVRGAKIIQTENSDLGVKVYAELFLGGNFKATIGLNQKRQKSSSDPRRAEELSP